MYAALQNLRLRLHRPAGKQQRGQTACWEGRAQEWHTSWKQQTALLACSLHMGLPTPFAPSQRASSRLRTAVLNTLCRHAAACQDFCWE